MCTFTVKRLLVYSGLGLVLLTLATYGQCATVLKSNVSGYHPASRVSEATVSVEAGCVNAPASQTISMTVGGLPHTGIPDTCPVVYAPSPTTGNQVIGSPQVVTVEVLADGSLQTVRTI